MTSKLQDELKQTKPFGSLEAEVWMSLHKTAQMLIAPWAAHLKEKAGLTTNQYNVLRILRGAQPDGLTCGEVADRMITRDPDVTRLLDRLVKDDLVKRERDTDDRRVVRVFIKKEGSAVLRRLDKDAAAMPPTLLSGLGKARLRELSELLDLVREGVEQHNSEA